MFSKSSLHAINHVEQRGNRKTNEEETTEWPEKSNQCFAETVKRSSQTRLALCHCWSFFTLVCLFQTSFDCPEAFAPSVHIALSQLTRCLTDLPVPVQTGSASPNSDGSAESESFFSCRRHPVPDARRFFLLCSFCDFNLLEGIKRGIKGQ